MTQHPYLAYQLQNTSAAINRSSHDQQEEFILTFNQSFKMAAALNFTAEKNAQFREILHNIIVIFDRMSDIPVMDEVQFLNAAENTHLIEVLSSVDHAFSFSKLPSSEMLHSDLCKALTGYIQTWVTIYRISTLAVSIWEKLRLDFPQHGIKEADNVKDSLKNASQTLHHIKKKLQDIDKCFVVILDMEDRENAEKEVTVMGYLVDVALVESKGCLNSVKIAKVRLDCLYVDYRRTENSFGNTVRMYAAAITSYLANAFGRTTKSAMASGTLPMETEQTTSRTTQEMLDYINSQLDAVDDHIQKLILLFQIQQ